MASAASSPMQRQSLSPAETPAPAQLQRPARGLALRRRERVDDVRLSGREALGLHAAPYDRGSLYIDADTFPCASFSGCTRNYLPALERYGVWRLIARCGAAPRTRSTGSAWASSPSAAYRTRKVFLDWLRTYEAQRTPTTDQRLFNEAAAAATGSWRCRRVQLQVELQVRALRVAQGGVALLLEAAEGLGLLQSAFGGVCAVDHECRFPVL